MPPKFNTPEDEPFEPIEDENEESLSSSLRPERLSPAGWLSP